MANILPKIPKTRLHESALRAMVQPLEIKNQRCSWRGIGFDAVYPKAKSAQTSFYPRKFQRIGALKVRHESEGAHEKDIP
jgi:hypothetical protein